MTGDPRFEAFEADVDALEGAMAEAGAMTAALSGEITKMQSAMAATSQDAEVLSKGLSRGLKSAFEGLVFDGFRASDALSAVARALVNTTFNAAITPVANGLSGLVTGAITGLFANGGAFSQGRVMPFASGGVVTGPTAFPLRGGTGLMGEAGPEAILPLARGADGRLGVRTSGGSQPVQVVMNISTPDATSFERSRNQIAAQMSRALSRAERNR